MKEDNSPSILNAYGRVVSDAGNAKALQVIRKVFVPGDAYWRGLGDVPGSGLVLNDEYKHFDIESLLTIDVSYSREAESCLCGQILTGALKPADCGLFRKVCRPENPVGPCMVSSEGTCSAFYKYTNC